MDLIVDGWFHERGDLWPGQAMSLKVSAPAKLKVTCCDFSCYIRRLTLALPPCKLFLIFMAMLRSIQVEEVLHHGRTKLQDILIFRSSNHGTVLVLDGVIQVTESDEYAYQVREEHAGGRSGDFAPGPAQCSSIRPSFRYSNQPRTFSLVFLRRPGNDHPHSALRSRLCKESLGHRRR